MGLITIKSAHVESEIVVLRSKLESEGIKCYLKNEFTTQILNHLPSFEVELQVAESDMSRAQEILNEIAMDPENNLP